MTADWSTALLSAGPLWRHQNRITISCTQKSASHADPHQTGEGRVKKERPSPAVDDLPEPSMPGCERNDCHTIIPPVPDDSTCISNICTDMPDVMLSTAAELAPRSKHPRGAQGWVGARVLA